MKKMINGKKYDTDTADEICHYGYSYTGGFDYYEDTLYRKKNGEFFIHSVGGARCNTWSGREEIYPIVNEEAMEIVESHCDVDKYEEIFGKVEE